jgi:hypothetical protein
VLAQNKKELLTNWWNEGKLEASEELGDAVSAAGGGQDSCCQAVSRPGGGGGGKDLSGDVSSGGQAAAVKNQQGAVLWAQRRRRHAGSQGSKRRAGGSRNPGHWGWLQRQRKSSDRWDAARGWGDLFGLGRSRMAWLYSWWPLRRLAPQARRPWR